MFSAGTQARGVNPLAITVMAERGIDISEAAGHRSKTLEEFLGQPMDLVVTVCDEAAEECPFFAGARRQEYWSFPDPSAATGTKSSGWPCSGRCATRLKRACASGWPRNQLREKPGRSGWNSSIVPLEAVSARLWAERVGSGRR